MCMQAQLTAQCTLALLDTQNARHTRSTHNAVHACTLPGEHNDGPSSCSSVRLQLTNTIGSVYLHSTTDVVCTGIIINALSLAHTAHPPNVD